MSVNTQERLAQLLQQEAQLKQKIQRAKARLSQQERKQRDSRLMAWGIAVEQLLQDGSFEAGWWESQCQRVLSGRTLERASQKRQE